MIKCIPLAISDLYPEHDFVIQQTATFLPIRHAKRGPPRRPPPSPLAFRGPLPPSQGPWRGEPTKKTTKPHRSPFPVSSTRHTSGHGTCGPSQPGPCSQPPPTMRGTPSGSATPRHPRPGTMTVAASSVVMCGCENWAIKKAEGQRIEAFEL